MTNESEEDGGIFAKCLGWLGCCFGALSPNSYYESSTMCQSELEKAREEAENSLYTGSIVAVILICLQLIIPLVTHRLVS